MITQRLAYFIGLLSSLSTAGSSMTLLALSASLFMEDTDGTASSSIQLMMYLGVAAVGTFGGVLLQKFSAPSIGLIGPMLSAVVVLVLASFTYVPITFGLAAAFLVFVLGGIDHPNNLRFLNVVLKDDEKISFFSKLEAFSYLMMVVTPLAAAWLISRYGVRTCFVVDAFTYIISAFPWLLVYQFKIPKDVLGGNPRWFIGFKELWVNTKLKRLTLGRLLNNLAYVPWAVALPLTVARLAHEDVGFFANTQGLAHAMLALGSIIAAAVGSFFLQGRSAIPKMVCLSPFMGYLAVVILIAGYRGSILVGASGLILGLGQYCFRLSGMILGQANTPRHLLGSVIVASDTIVRFWSLMVSVVVILCFQWNIQWIILVISACALVTPTFVLNLAYAYQFNVDVFTEIP